MGNCCGKGKSESTDDEGRQNRANHGVPDPVPEFPAASAASASLVDKNAPKPSTDPEATTPVLEPTAPIAVTDSDDRNPLQKPAAVVTRKSITKMTADEQERFALAIKQMMVNVDGKAGTSPYATLAGYHGWPNEYCHHGQETFPSWHRGYLVEFEQELRKADKALGNDGNIGLPYWDWAAKDFKGLPTILRKHFVSMPPDLVNKDDIPELSRFYELGWSVDCSSPLHLSGVGAMFVSCTSCTRLLCGED
eukprot:m.1001596 g.1001596  ORF g.1001596 m.1001596 type:complete len:250 (+) comp24031_c0_seq6:88-837(+)